MVDQKQGEGRDFRKVGRAFTREILVPIFLALLVIQFVIQAFKIPSASMEDSLLIGDFLLGLKFVYGAPIPFSHKKLPGITDPKPGQVLIFRYPGDPAYPEDDKVRYRFLANLFLFGNLYWDKHPAEGEKQLVWYAPKDFIKRCVAQSGQTLRVADKQLFVGGKESPLPPKGKHMTFRGRDMQRDSLIYRLPAPGDVFDFDTLTLKDATWIRSLAWQENQGKRVELQLDLVKDSVVDNDYIMPYLNGDPENRQHRIMYALLNLNPRSAFADNVPYLTVENVPFKLIQDAARTGFIRTNDLPLFSGVDPSDPEAMRKLRSGRRVENSDYFIGSNLELINQNVIGQGNAAGRQYRIKPYLIIDGVAVHKYAVKKKCYFMMGDNRDNSSDSRYWGLLSQDFVKAKAFIIYFSLDDEEGDIRLRDPFTWLKAPFRIRWTRIGKLIH